MRASWVRPRRLDLRHRNIVSSFNGSDRGVSLVPSFRDCLHRFSAARFIVCSGSFSYFASPVLFARVVDGRGGVCLFVFVLCASGFPVLFRLTVWFCLVPYILVLPFVAMGWL